LRNLLTTLTQPRILIPVLISAALLAFVLTISDAAAVMGKIQGIPIGIMALALGLAVLYLVLKGFLWHYFMNVIQISISWRQLVLAFAVGEIAVSLPAGIYAQNYVLRRVAGADFSRSSAATTALLAGEATISMVVLAIFGIPGWDWLRPAIIGLFAVSAVVVAILLGVRQVRDLAGRLLRMGPLRTIGPEFLEMVESARMLLTPRVALHSIPVIAAYLLALVAAFYLVAHGVGVTALTFLQATTVYLFALAVVLVSPISSHLGVVEAGGLGAMHAWGYSSTEGIAALLGFRLVWTGAVWLVCIPVVVLLHREFLDAGKG
jgi:uncharacterized membrane protein YbhN (UPF0104 family)